jgi:hypothetical protein
MSLATGAAPVAVTRIDFEPVNRGKFPPLIVYTRSAKGVKYLSIF